MVLLRTLVMSVAFCDIIFRVLRISCEPHLFIRYFFSWSFTFKFQFTCYFCFSFNLKTVLSGLPFFFLNYTMYFSLFFIVFTFILFMIFNSVVPVSERCYCKKRKKKTENCYDYFMNEIKSRILFIESAMLFKVFVGFVIIEIRCIE